MADSRPAHYLILLEQVELLRRFGGQVVVPEAVASEFSIAGAPRVVRDWITALPSWVEIRPRVTDDLDLGERAAIALAETMRADRLVPARTSVCRPTGIFLAAI